MAQHGTLLVTLWRTAGSCCPAVLRDFLAKTTGIFLADLCAVSESTHVSNLRTSRTRVSNAGASATAALLAALLQANPASADLFTSFGGGVFVGYGSGSFMWGLETLATHSYGDNRECAKSPRYALGPLARLSWRNLSRPAFTLTGFAAQELERGRFGLGVEAGGTLGFPGGLESDPVPSVHTGLFGEVSIINASVWQEWMLGEYPVAVGARSMPTFGPLNSCAPSAVGRPQRAADGHRTCPSEPPKSRSLGRAKWHDELAADWLDYAHQEYESVPAFLQLAHELASLSAPACLVRRARTAAIEELEHTALCLDVAGLDESISSMSVPRIARRDALIGFEGITRMALESWVDGCLGEGLAARLAADESRPHAVDGIRRVQGRIARDEHRHAVLGWDILRWCVGCEPEVKGLLTQAREVNLRPAEVRVGDARRRASIAQRHRRACQRRLEALCA
jgi:hypothetical protein